MKILIAPLIRGSKADSSWLISRNIADLFLKRGHGAAVSTDKTTAVASAALYDCAPLKKPFFHTGSRLSYEEWLYEAGAASEEYLKADMQCLFEAMDHFQPDLVITIDRIAAAVAARSRDIPCLAVIHTSMYRNNSFPVKCLQETNRILSAYDQEQVFRAHSVYDSCTARVAFGAIQFQPFPEEVSVQRIGVPAFMMEPTENSGRVVIFFSQIAKKSSALKKIILDTFLGAPYPISAWVSDTAAEKKNNVQFLSSFRDDLLKDASVCIHDGSDYICHLCAAAAVPQLIVSTHEYGRISNALAAKRYGYGTYIEEDHLSVASLYEAYRQIISNPQYASNASSLRDEIISLGDLEDFYRKVCTAFRNRL